MVAILSLTFIPSFKMTSYSLKLIRQSGFINEILLEILTVFSIISAHLHLFSERKKSASMLPPPHPICSIEIEQTNNLHLSLVFCQLAGGYDEYPDNVHASYRNSFEGCVKDVKLDETVLHLYHNAIDVQPTDFCPDD